MYCPKVSVIVPVYNVEPYIRRCIDSIINQTYKNLEIILVDDGSADSSGKICDEYAARDARILVRHSANGGLVSARKAGTCLAQGEYVSFVDGDDWIDSNRMEQAVLKLQDERVDMLYLGGYIREFKDERAFIVDDFVEETFCGDDMARIFPLLQVPDKAFKRALRPVMWNWIIRKDIVAMQQSQADERISMGEDMLAIWSCALSANSARVFQCPTYHYTQRPGSLMCVFDSKEAFRMKLLSRQLMEAVEKSRHKSNDVVRTCAALSAIQTIVFSDWTLLLKAVPNCLVPYMNVKRGSRIVVFGAGKIGFHMVDAISRVGGYEIVAVCDNNTQRPAINGHEILLPKDAVKLNSDFVVVAVGYESMAMQMKNDLLSLNVPENKIALMSANILNEALLKRVFGYEAMNI